MRVLVSGATGLIGTAVVTRLTETGDEPIRLVRAAPVGSDVRWDPAAGAIDAGQDVRNHHGCARATSIENARSPQIRIDEQKGMRGN